jgi:hypothetical protein
MKLPIYRAQKETQAASPPIFGLIFTLAVFRVVEQVLDVRKCMTDYNATRWIWTFAIGVPILTASVWWRWRQSQVSVASRWVLCAIIAGMVTPFVFKDESTDIYPASVALLFFVISSFRDHSPLYDYFRAIWVCVLPILAVSLAILGIWSIMLSCWKKGKPRAATNCQIISN